MVTVVHWNPYASDSRALRTRRRVARRVERVGRRTLSIKRVDNFGDLLGPMIVRGVIGELGMSNPRRPRRRLLSVGSILHLANDGDTVWGAGRNGNIQDVEHRFDRLDVRSVRGPITRTFLQERSIECPEVFGDPALLLARYMPELRERASQPAYSLTVVPNLMDLATSCPVSPWEQEVISPLSPMGDVLRRIASSRLVVGSSLHAVVVAESLGIPARVVRSRHESSLKYEDYYLGTGRGDVGFADDVDHAVRLGGAPPPVWSAESLLEAFPADLFRSR